MNEKVIRAKHTQLCAGEVVVMSDAELDWLIDHDLHGADVVSIRNPQQVGTLDAYLVGKKSCATMRAHRARTELLTSAARGARHSSAVWDEPKGATTPRGWYWPSGSTRRGETTCAGHYVDYGADHKRFDDRQVAEPGNIQCVVLDKDGQAMSWRYVTSVEQARQWIEAEAANTGHIA